ncbi:type III PLP-dependent enzyme [Streptomyces sp. NPDC021225]|uniref:type III PLP-dependent enzyme n=1 Tax=Streptomyces sp. NPDC021225 TaxID=3365121 RepID=UPI00378C9FC3
MESFDAVQGIRAAELADHYGTPLYVYDGELLTGAVRSLAEALPPPVEIFYSLKANPNSSVCSLLFAHGTHAEVSSLVELRTARTAGARPENIIFLGPGKTTDDIRACVQCRVYAIVCESWQELELIEATARQAGLRQRVLLRVNPSFGAAGSRLAMGGKPRQFGIDEEQLLDGKDRLSALTHATPVGVHVYLGTRILDAAAIVENTAQVLALAERVAAATGIEPEAIDIGGGLGVAYFDGERDLDLDALREGLAPVVGDFARRHPRTRLLLESGRFLTARAGAYLVRVQYVKESRGTWFAVTDGGTHHHMAAVGVGSYARRNFPVAAVAGGGTGPERPWHITGPLCTPDDTLARAVPLPDLAPGDVLAVLRSGAYGPTASPGLFLSHGFPAEVLVHEGRPLLVRDRDTADDLLRKQRHHQFVQ